MLTPWPITVDELNKVAVRAWRSWLIPERCVRASKREFAWRSERECVGIAGAVRSYYLHSGAFSRHPVYIFRYWEGSVCKWYVRATKPVMENDMNHYLRWGGTRALGVCVWVADASTKGVWKICLLRARLLDWRMHNTATNNKMWNQVRQWCNME